MWKKRERSSTVIRCGIHHVKKEKWLNARCEDKSLTTSVMKEKNVILIRTPTNLFQEDYELLLVRVTDPPLIR